MLIVMKADATERDIAEVERVINELGYRPHTMPGASRTAIGITGNDRPRGRDALRESARRGRGHPRHQALQARLARSAPEKTVVRVGDAEIGGDELAIIAGPCAVESREQAFAIAEAVRRSGARFFRGGAFKPRTSPYAFQGLGEEGLKTARRSPRGVRAEDRDRGGGRGERRPRRPLRRRASRSARATCRTSRSSSARGARRLPVLLKRGLSATLDEWLLAAEYIMAEGNYNVILCERGVRTFAQHTRNTLDLAAVPAVQRISHLPVVVDPSHGTGKNYMVTPLARAGVAVGADGLIIEVHNQPERALSDGAQSLTLEQYEQLVHEVRAIHEVIAPAPVG